MTTAKPDNYNKGLPGIPLASLDAIQDDNTRQVLRAIVDGWHVRNGSSGDGKSRFVTAAELGDLSGTVGGLRQSVSQIQQQRPPLSSSEIGRIITDLQASVMESVLFKELGDRITLIDLTAARNLADGLLAEATARQAAITTETTARQTADSSLASQITTITAAVNTNAAAIQTEATARANADTAEANARLTLAARVSTAESAITTEQTARVNADNAITTSVSTQFSTVNGNISALQTSQTTTANNVAALSSSVSTLQVTVGQNTAAIQTEATARVNSDNDIYAKYSVKIDNNGYVTGFGLISTANNSTPYSEFVVRADRFAIGSPSGPGITPVVPFIVTTTTDSKGNPPGVYMDYTMIKKADIGTAQIDNAAVTTLKIGGNAVTVPTYAANTIGAVTITTSWTTVASAWVTISGLDTGETAGTIITGYSTFYENGGADAALVTGIFVADTQYAISACTVGESKTNCLTSFAYAPNGTYRIDLKVKTDTGSGGAATKSFNNIIGGIIVMSGKR